ncbi:MAG: tRNA (guanosine(46)-N7)-methyltransferase TrmB [Chthoniobacterales bacterium]
MEESAELPQALEAELVPSNYFAPLALAEVFSRTGPLEIDIGCGDGAFLVARAGQFPDRNFLGLEKLAGRIRRACKKTSRLDLTNARFLRIESVYAIQYLLPPASAEIAHLLFPDPWPKKKHRRRRIVTKEFLDLVHRVLVTEGRFRIATDQENYFAAMRELISPAQFIEVAPSPDEGFPITTFEKHFLKEGVTIHRLELRKVS